ncbi:MAG: T9SS type A sorting domain-containing protein [candidate division KSB1 bacterium]|nr:T9SS type A sorting domain-containing protein [candidate division KSB1 bacterium]MDZ7273097.1 T9SS type A sorting domain-containing protein [candidate division KSB1 bacterium]MDZ7285199.1 T9SS type A sorting domain-containing protein [candidate division KSB1 bacterium]MDZ7298231.1 T9SS type A sorting domain-containing protein [candidate division KSB1 bacterium]MDZ7306733.1 T9SS type A sorting domain-containing protein [candidate division KSB1 bacterium]
MSVKRGLQRAIFPAAALLLWPASFQPVVATPLVNAGSSLRQQLVRISPNPIIREAAAGHPVYYVLTIANLGETADRYRLATAGHLWPVTILTADTARKITETGELAAGGQFNFVIQLDVPSTAARGVRDTLWVGVTSLTDPGIRDSSFVATTSLGAAATLPFIETFATTALSPVRWLDNFGPAVINNRAQNEPSPAFSLNFDGSATGGDLVQSQPINLAGKRDVVFQFAYQRGGEGSNSPETGDDFFVDYYNRDGEWLNLITLPGAGPRQTVFEPVSVILPHDAYHSSLRLRFRNIATPGPFDDWFIDDIRLLDLPPARLPFADSFTERTLAATLWPENNGALVNDLALNPPSPPYALNLPGGSSVQSVPLDLSVENAVSLRYYFEQTGAGEEPDAGDDLVIEFRDAANNWQELVRHPGEDGGLPVFTRKEIVLPPAAYHRNFRLRFRNTGAQDRDDWFVDDVRLDVFAPSDIAVTPASITVKLFENDHTTRLLRIDNTGVGDLFYSLRIVPPDFGTARRPPANQPFWRYPRSHYTAPGKHEIDGRRGHPVVAGRGGPDNFGYTWRDSNDPAGPTFNWQDIAATGTRIPDAGDDDNLGPFVIGFAFPFYDSVYTTFRFCTNGFISFSSTSSAFSNNPVPSLGVPDLVAPFWDDLEVRSGAAYYHADGNKLIVQWQNVRRASGEGPYTFQLVLTPEGNILFQYLSLAGPANFCTVGIQNRQTSDGLEVAFNTNYVKDSLAVLISRPASWLAFTPRLGILGSGRQQEVALEFRAAGLSPALTYQAELRVESNDLDEPSVPVHLTLEVLALSDTTRHFPDPETTAVRYPMVIERATIAGVDLAAGDEIGVFTPGGKLAGSVVWPARPPVRLVAYGDDPATTAVEGFKRGETIYFRIWDSSRGERDYPATATYTRGDGSFGTADSAHIALLAAQITFTRRQNLTAGWSWISLNVAPANPAVEAAFHNTKHLRILKDLQGHVFIPNLVNTLGNISPLAGYAAYLDAPDSLSVVGEEVAPFTPIPLAQGYNFVGYLPAGALPAVAAFASLLDNLVIAKDDQGGFLIPALGLINTMGNLRPGRGYKLYLSRPDTLIYPLGAGSALAKIHDQPAGPNEVPVHFSGVARGSESYIVVITAARVAESALQPGDEIGIFTPAGELVGAGVWPAGGMLGIAAWRSESLAENEGAGGYVADTPMQFRIWRKAENLELQATPRFQRSNGTFEHEAYALVELEGSLLPAAFSLDQSHPNPFPLLQAATPAQTTIRYALPQAGMVTIRVYNLLGQVVRTLRQEPQKAGYHSLQWDGRDDHGRLVARGVYLYRMQAGAFRAVRKLLVM